MQKYKVFLNEKRIVFVPGANITLSKLSGILTKNSTVEDIMGWVQSFEKNNISETVVKHPECENVFQQFRSAFLQIDAAGGVVKKGELLLFIFRNGKWDLPKGKIDKGESIENAALREVEEECGISNHTIKKALPSTYHIYKSPYKKTFGQWIFKETFWFEMDYSGNETLTPQLDEGITEVRWFHPNELNVVLENTYENLKALIELYRA
ncbi:NUDIX domain-containing protein [Draconibacterium sp. IB214405]|uniref:NUDIX hydrolase n=1 Tax=Draconibacterium sp. IB214405 TaxID=3097352 RepID=UPI002A1049C6|nr:NUDIX domain-containing protein [Draconibacterium sp. IB214405]MDX8338365.1 NUDIX domain-containing protein [Draconibacterium sp. IB214405]